MGRNAIITTSDMLLCVCITHTAIQQVYLLYYRVKYSCVFDCMHNTQKCFLLNQHNGDDAPQILIRQITNFLHSSHRFTLWISTYTCRWQYCDRWLDSIICLYTSLAEGCCWVLGNWQQQQQQGHKTV